MVLPMTQPPSPPAAQYPITVKYNRYLGIAMLIVGILSLIVSLKGAANLRWTGTALTVAGIAYTFGTALIIDADRVRVKSVVQVTVRDLPIEGLRDLYFEGDQLYRASDDRKLLNLGWGAVRRSDIEALKQQVVAAGGHRPNLDQPA